MNFRWETQRVNMPLESILERFQPTSLHVMFPRGRPYRLTRLRHLTIDSFQKPSTEVLPPMFHLKSLEIRASQANAGATTTSCPFVNLCDFTSLEQLYVQGDLWSRVQETFTGKSCTIQTCILEGALVVGKRSDEFFERIAPGLRAIFCQGTHLVGELETAFPQLAFLALHKTINSTGTFPFRNSAIHAVSLEVDDSYGPGRLQDSNEFLQLVLTRTESTLRFLTLRSGLWWMPSLPTVKSFQRMACLSDLMLDGALDFGRHDWTALHCSLNLHLVTTIDTWIKSGVSRPYQVGNSV